MKLQQPLVWMAVASAFIFVGGCSQPAKTVTPEEKASDKSAEPVIASKLVGITLKPTDLSVIETLGDRLPLLIDAPESSEVKSGTGYIEVVQGNVYQLFVQNTAVNIAEMKEYETNGSKVHEVVADEPEKYIAKISSGDRDPKYVIILNKKIGETVYGVNNRIAAWKPETKEDLEVVLKSIESLREKPGSGEQPKTEDKDASEPAEKAK